MRDRLLDLRESLLRGGLSPRHVERYLRELSEHRDDIAEHLRESGLPAAEAYGRADDRLGGDDAILLPMLANSRFRSRAARWPAIFYVALPRCLPRWRSSLPASSRCFVPRVRACGPSSPIWAPAWPCCC